MPLTIKEIEKPRQLSNSIQQLTQMQEKFRELLFKESGIPKKFLIDSLQEKLNSFYYE